MAKKGSRAQPGALPDPKQWYRLGDWPFPVQVAATIKSEAGEVVGIGLYLRVPLPWEDYLTPWPPTDPKETN